MTLCVSACLQSLWEVNGNDFTHYCVQYSMYKCSAHALMKFYICRCTYQLIFVQDIDKYCQGFHLGFSSRGCKHNNYRVKEGKDYINTLNALLLAKNIIKLIDFLNQGGLGHALPGHF